MQQGKQVVGEHDNFVPPRLVLNEIIFPDQSGGEAQFTVRPHDFVDPPEGGCGDELDFVEYQQTPVPLLYLVEDILRGLSVFSGVRHHGIRRDEHARLSSRPQIAFVVGREGNQLLRGDVGEVHELFHPLFNGYRRGREHKNGFPYRACGDDAGERLTGTTRKDDDARPGTPVAEHPPERSLLVVSDLNIGADTAFQRWCFFILSEIVFHDQRSSHRLQCLTLQFLNFFLVYLERVDLASCAVFFRYLGHSLDCYGHVRLHDWPRGVAGIGRVEHDGRRIGGEHRGRDVIAVLSRMVFTTAPRVSGDPRAPNDGVGEQVVELFPILRLDPITIIP
ncbi:hypothetical protein BOVATA_024060 [Babesia ovata]|uniref:Uncharacterized protein n=1 Tax=Babesia ovata TaxID=189622 RepID=A0A2H6KD41_9APIC|nr:uncharacterized protein BOVATA_024060 [Babesia ovata]GBE60913.1 hypothetical protein BOVATA_024060 [Babesia ovata]